MCNKGTVLLVDNDFYLTNANENEFYRRGYIVKVATTYSKAVDILKETDPDIIVMEATLPNEDGFSFLSHIRNETSAAIIVLTMKKSESAMKKALEMGADDYIIKPIKNDVMVTKAETVIRRWKN